MTIHKRSIQGAPPGHMHRQRRNEPTLKQKIARAQSDSTSARKAPVTLKEAPWGREVRNG